MLGTRPPPRTVDHHERRPGDGLRRGAWKRPLEQGIAPDLASGEVVEQAREFDPLRQRSRRVQRDDGRGGVGRSSPAPESQLFSNPFVMK